MSASPPFDIIDSYVKLISHTTAASAFARWSAISMVAASLERRCWLSAIEGRPLFPNLFVLLIAHPAIGKTEAVIPADDLMSEAACFHPCPTDITRASMVDYLAGDTCKEKFIIDGIENEYHSVFLFVSEFGVLFRSHDLEFVSLISDLYDNKKSYLNLRVRRGDKPLIIPNPQLTLLAATQPQFIAVQFPEAAWGQGLMSRFIMIHSREEKKVQLFDGPTWDSALHVKIVNRLRAIKCISGQFRPDDQAKEAIRAWYNQGMGPKPSNPRLQFYIGRRLVHLLKLCMVSSASRYDDKIIHLEDFQRAFNWLISAEEQMPFIFQDMINQSEARIVFELWDWAMKESVGSGYKPLHKSRLIVFLQQRLPHYTVEKTLGLAVQANIFKVDTKTPEFYRPQPRAIWQEHVS